MSLAPIALFTYTKLKPLIATVEALKKNDLAIKSELIVFSDGAKNTKDDIKVTKVRDYLKTINGFKKVTLIISSINKGLANSIIDGVSEILKNNETVIVMEDDLLCSTNFLMFMNSALEFYKNDAKIFSIAGYTPPINPNKTKDFDIYFTKRASSWGWATYRSQWENVDWKVKNYQEFKIDTKAKIKFNLMGSDLTNMLKKQMEGKLDSWAIIWCFHQFQNNLYTVFPTTSKIINIGFDNSGTHTKNKNLKSRFATNLDNSNKTHFNWDQNVSLKPEIMKDFTKPYNLTSRFKYKLLSILNR